MRCRSAVQTSTGGTGTEFDGPNGDHRMAIEHKLICRKNKLRERTGESVNDVIEPGTKNRAADYEIQFFKIP
jgi:hypothetical protein